MAFADRPLVDVIRACMAMDAFARDTYLRLSRICPDPRLAPFWRAMSVEEGAHVRFWETVLQLAEEGLLPPLIEDPEQTLSDLRKNREGAEALVPVCEADPSTLHMFLLAYRLEFALLCPAVAAFFHYMKTTTSESPEDRYEEHLLRFGRKLDEVGGATPELALLGEAVLRLWRDHRHLAIQSAHDELTGVLNRRGLFNAIRPLAFLAMRNALTAGLIMVDIDDFKTVNEEHGHVQADRVLADVAGALAGRMRKSDIIGRYGGEEFLVFLPEVDPRALPRICEDLRERVAAATAGRIPVTVSLGAASGVFEVHPDEDLMDLVRKADSCLYTAKRSGKNRSAVEDE